MGAREVHPRVPEEYWRVLPLEAANLDCQGMRAFMRGRVFSMHSAVISIFQVMQYPAHDLPVTGLGFAPGDTGAQLGGYDLVAASADYKITLLKSQGK